MVLSKYSKLALLIMSIITICSLSSSIYLGFIMLRETSYDLALQKMSFNLGIDASWEAVDRYMLSKLKKGMPREQVLREFNKAGPYIIKLQSGSCELVEFKPGILNITSYMLRVCYESDKAQSLKHFSFRDD